MPELLIRLTKRVDGDVVLRCVRADGTATWQRHHGQKAAFFPLHDLTHYAVETELAFRRGFYGLIAEGWDIPDTGESRTRGPLPAETVAVEHIVGLLDVERAGGCDWGPDELNAQLAAFPATRGIPSIDGFAADDWSRLRTRVRELLGRWRQLPPGETLELSFDRSPPSLEG